MDYQNSLPCILKNPFAFSDKEKHVKIVDVNYMSLILSTPTHVERGKNGNES